MPKTEPTKEELQTRAQQVRTLEGVCKIEHPNDEERAFRVALMKALGKAWNLREVKALTIS